MADPKDQITALVQAAEQAAYHRGWADALAALRHAAEAVIAPDVDHTPSQTPARSEPRKTGRPASATIQVVEDCINASPGKKGVDVVKAAQMVDPHIPERTVRTALRRLKMQKKIYQRNNLWYPKPKVERYRATLLDIENDDEETTNSPPHQ
jgi:hypothetical protein